MIRTTSSIMLFVVLFLFLLPRPVHTAAAWSVEGNRYIRKKLPNTLTSQETTFHFPDESKIIHEDHYSTNKDNADMYTEEKLPNRDFLYHKGGWTNAGGGLAFLTDDHMAQFTKPQLSEECMLEPPYHDLFQWF